MLILVTGATGHIGRRLAQALLTRRHAVRTLVLPDDPGLAAARQAGIECHIGSLAEPEAVRRAAEQAEATFHLAAVIYLHPHQRHQVWESNVLGTYHVLEAAQSGRRFIFASSDQVYPGPAALYRPTDERHPRLPNTFYGLSKVIGEELVTFYGRSAGLQTTIARFAHVEASEELIDPRGFFARRLFFVNGRLDYLRESGSTDPKILATIRTLESLAAPDEPLLLPYDRTGQPYQLELTDVRDIVAGLLLLLDCPEAVGETFNLAPPKVVSLGELIPFMAQATGRRYVEAQLELDAPYCHTSSAKAATLIGYRPQYTAFDMVAEATGFPRSAPAAETGP